MCIPDQFKQLNNLQVSMEKSEYFVYAFQQQQIKKFSKAYAIFFLGCKGK